MPKTDVRVETVSARAYEIPTDAPESDGTLEWDKTTLVLVEVTGGGETGIGYTYADAAIVKLIDNKLAEVAKGRDATNIAGTYWAMQNAVRNLNRSGLVMMAISAVDAALWDLKAKLLGLPLVSLLGAARDSVGIYGSGGFTSYSDARLREQLGRWAHEDGCAWVKMKVGREPNRDPERVRAVREAVGDTAICVDANGAYTLREALTLAQIFGDMGVVWFEEPRSSDDLEGLKTMRLRSPVNMDIAAGEYCATQQEFQAMLSYGAVDVQQADMTRCGGVSGVMQAGALCEAYQRDLSGHCAPAQHLHVLCAVPRLLNLEWFHDHVRIEHMLFDGAPVPRDGRIAPDLSRPGVGLDFKRQDAERFAV